jgi:hypothetical protein
LKFSTKIQTKYFKNFKLGFGFRYWVLKKSDSGSGTGSGFENFPKNRVLGSGSKPGTGSFASLFLGPMEGRISFNNNWIIKS